MNFAFRGCGLRPFASISVICLAATAAVTTAATAQGRPPYLADLPAFNPQITSPLPGDIDISLQQSLEKQGKFAEVQSEFDLNAWQMFLALNWPVGPSGQPKTTLTDDGDPRWSTWTPSYKVFRSDGRRPAACGRRPGVQQMLSLTTSDDMNLSVSRGLPATGKLMKSGAEPAPPDTSSNSPKKNSPEAMTTTRTPSSPSDRGGFHLTLGTISSVGELNGATLSDIKQAFSGPLIDQNGQLVFYQIVIDPHEVQYVCENSLYNINGQVAFSEAGKKVVMPSGTSAADASGAFELKFAWKILQGTDDPKRFYHIPATVIDIEANGTLSPREVTVGLVGMHIGHKSESSPQWIWDTFEQVDNVEADPLADPKPKLSFTDPACVTCAVNQPTQPNGTGGLVRTPTQVRRAIPIPPAKIALNLQVRTRLKGLGSVWQFYQLVDAQWPTEPTAPPTPPSAGAPTAVTNKPGGHPTPVFLTNVTMETFFQTGNQSTCGQLEGGACVPNAPGPKMVFATESCMGCHSSAGIFKSYDPAEGSGKTAGPLTADFSWLLAQKACWVGGKPDPDSQNCTTP